MKNKLSEKEITRQVRDVLKACKIWHYKHYNGGAFQPRKGISDIIGIYNGRFLAIELKKQGWSPPGPEAKSYRHFTEQRDFIQEVKDAGGIGFFASSVEEVIEQLDLNAILYPLFEARR